MAKVRYEKASQPVHESCDVITRQLRNFIFFSVMRKYTFGLVFVVSSYHSDSVLHVFTISCPSLVQCYNMYVYVSIHICMYASLCAGVFRHKLLREVLGRLFVERNTNVRVQILRLEQWHLF